MWWSTNISKAFKINEKRLIGRYPFAFLCVMMDHVLLKFTPFYWFYRDKTRARRLCKSGRCRSVCVEELWFNFGGGQDISRPPSWLKGGHYMLDMAIICLAKRYFSRLPLALGNPRGDHGYERDHLGGSSEGSAIQREGRASILPIL